MRDALDTCLARPPANARFRLGVATARLSPASGRPSPGRPASEPTKRLPARSEASTTRASARTSCATLRSAVKGSPRTIRNSVRRLAQPPGAPPARAGLRPSPRSCPPPPSPRRHPRSSWPGHRATRHRQPSPGSASGVPGGWRTTRHATMHGSRPVRRRSSSGRPFRAQNPHDRSPAQYPRPVRRPRVAAAAPRPPGDPGSTATGSSLAMPGRDVTARQCYRGAGQAAARGRAS